MVLESGASPLTSLYATLHRKVGSCVLEAQVQNRTTTDLKGPASLPPAPSGTACHQ
jgi:hypothetical protein